MASDFLTQMAAASRARVASARRRLSEAALLAETRDLPPPPALELGSFDVIAELKLRSPAAGGLAAAGFDVDAQIEAYAQGGASAVSVLTEPERFGGNLEHLRAAAEGLAGHGIPVMRKDFLTDAYQVVEARAAGAAGVLVIVTMLEDPEIVELVAAARERALFVLLEAFDADDLERLAALSLPDGNEPLLAGVNCRNLKDLQVDFERFAELASALPSELPTIAESGIESPAQAERVAELGYSGALIGSALMRAESPARLLQALVTAGCRAREA